MKALVLDPIIFVRPPLPIDAKSAELFIQRLLFLRDFRESASFEVFVPDSAYNILSDTGSYPNWPEIADILSHIDINQFQVKDIASIITSMLDKSKSLEQATGIACIVLENTVCDPNDHLVGRSSRFCESHFEIAGQSLLLAKRADSLQLVTNGVSDDTKVEYSIDVVDIEYILENKLLDVGRIVGEIIVSSTCARLFLILDPLLHWVRYNENDCHFSIRTIVAQHAEKTGRSSNDAKLWVLGRDFIKSIRSHNIFHTTTYSKKLFRAISETLFDEALADVHSIRVDSGGGSPQVRRGEDKAWRRDIDDEYHLHYWETEFGIEFACVVVHNDMSIPK